jgi:hypothetical protein
MFECEQPKDQGKNNNFNVQEANELCNSETRPGQPPEYTSVVLLMTKKEK